MNFYEHTSTSCAQCAVGCGIVAGGGAEHAPKVSGDPEHPANLGRLCSKGAAPRDTLGLEGRLLYPEVAGNQVGWGHALGLVARNFAGAVRDYGPGAVAIYMSGTCLTEDFYVAAKLMKGFIGSANLTANPAACLSAAAEAQAAAFGEDIVPGCFDDIEEAGLVVLVGADVETDAPVLHDRIRAARAAQPGRRFVAIGAPATGADLHLALTPGSEGLLFAGLLVHLAETGALDTDFIENHTSGFEATLLAARRAAPGLDAVASGCGLAPVDVERFYRWFAETDRTVSLYGTGLEATPGAKGSISAILNCHLATGRIGLPGRGPLPLPSQVNAMGGREAAGLTGGLVAHLRAGESADEKLLQDFWQSPTIASGRGPKARDLFRAVADGRIRALWVIGADPVANMPKGRTIADALKRCDFLAVSGCHAGSATAAHADVLLPSLAWGEKDGTVTTAERRINRQRAFLPAPGEARADWWQLAGVARAMGFADAFGFNGAAQIFREHAALSGYRNDGERAFDISGLADLSNADYDALRPLQWPVRYRGSEGSKRLLGDGTYYHADLCARFIATTPSGPARCEDEEFPLVLNTGRVQESTSVFGVAATARTAPVATVDISPADAAAHGVREDDMVRLESPHGHMVARVCILRTQEEGTLSVSMNTGGTFADQARVDALVPAVLDLAAALPRQAPVRLSACEPRAGRRPAPARAETAA
ncbi:MAG: nitrate reductase [Alphaproteobacteria bacterium]|nr:MAG: nitrate reductase [Alphaproteobacteria bacterium]